MFSKEKCYNSDIFLDKKLIEKFTCSICLGVFRNPVNDDCGHVFGFECIKEARSHNNKCPLTNLNYSPNSKFSKILPLNEFLNDLQVFCAYKAKGCKWNGPLKELEVHLTTNCNCEMVSCENRECAVKVERSKMKNHLKKECNHNYIPCILSKNGCNERIIAKDIIKHIDEKHFDEMMESFENLRFVDELKIENEKLKKIFSEHKEKEKEKEKENNLNSFPKLTKFFRKPTSLNQGFEKIDEEMDDKRFYMPYTTKMEKRVKSSRSFYEGNLSTNNDKRFSHLLTEN